MDENLIKSLIIIEDIIQDSAQNMNFNTNLAADYTSLGYMTLEDGRKVQVQLILEADDAEWIAD